MDLNLLPSLHVLLTEESVTRASRRLHLSVPATSRVLERGRRAFGDPLLVRRGRGLVMTPRGAALLHELGPLVRAIDAVVAPPRPFEASRLRRSFVIRSNEAVLAALGSRLLEEVGAVAPGVELHFEAEGADDLDALGGGTVDLCIGSYGRRPPEIQVAPIATERLVGVLRAGHPALGRRMTRRRFAALDHIVTSRRGVARGPVDRELATGGLTRRISAVVPSFSAALAMTAGSDATTLAPARLARTFAGAESLVVFDLPMALPVVEVHQLWHARHEADAEHRWLRATVQGVAEGAEGRG